MTQGSEILRLISAQFPHTVPMPQRLFNGTECAAPSHQGKDLKGQDGSFKYPPFLRCRISGQLSPRGSCASGGQVGVSEDQHDRKEYYGATRTTLRIVSSLPQSSMIQMEDLSEA